MYEVITVRTMRGETYTFGGANDAVSANFVGGGDFLQVRKNGADVAFFPTRNVEAVLRSKGVDEVAE